MSLAHAHTQRNALAEFVTGKTLQLGSDAEGSFEGAELIDWEASGGYASLGGQGSESVDSIVSWWGVEHTQDTIAAMREWRRVLREGGTLALVIRDGGMRENWSHAPHSFTAESLQNVIRYAGGFEVSQVTELEDGQGWLVVATRDTVMDLRNLLGMQGSVLADAATRGEEHRAELCFQFGTILLRAGETALAAPCFETALRHDPDSAESVFGLGMCRTLQRQWASAIAALQRAVELDSENREARRWLGLARLECDGESSGAAGGPQGALG